MINEWSTFNSDDKGHCIAETTMGGVWSYTTWSPVWKCHAMYENCTSGQTASPSQPSGDCRRRRVIASRHDSPDRTTALHIGESDEQMETDKLRRWPRYSALAVAQAPTIILRGDQPEAMQVEQPNRVSIEYVAPQNPELQELYGRLRDRHALERMHNLLCLAFRADPVQFSDASDFLPSARSSNCKWEYQTLVHAFRKEIRPHVDQEMAKQVLDTD